MRITEAIRALRRGEPPALGSVPPRVLDLLAAAESRRGRVMELSSLSRCLAAIRHCQPDRVPVTPLANAAARRLVGVSFPEYSTDPYKAAEVICASLEIVGGDMAILLLDLAVEAEGFGQPVLYPEHSTARPDYDRPIIRDVSDYDRIRPVDLADCKRMQNFLTTTRLVVKRTGFSSLVAGFVFGPLGVLSMMRGAQNLFMDCMSHPRKVARACEAITETLLAFTGAQCDAGAAGVAIDSLFASATCLSKNTWEAIEGPFCREIANLIRKKGRAVGIHNCGHGIYFDAQIRSMDPEIISFAQLPDDCASLREVKEKYGGRVTLLGLVPTPLLVHGTPRQVMDEAQREIEILGRDGGFILAPGCEYPPNLDLTNAFALVRAARG
ncbi:MAG: uroporphyrinogen decarboxylase family protein [Pseudomonadota bacterium]